MGWIWMVYIQTFIKCKQMRPKTVHPNLLEITANVFNLETKYMMRPHGLSYLQAILYWLMKPVMACTKSLKYGESLQRPRALG